MRGGKKVEMTFRISRKEQSELMENKDALSNNGLGKQITEFRSVKIRKDLFDLLKLYCLCHNKAPRDVVTRLVEDKLRDFRSQLEQIRKQGGWND